MACNTFSSGVSLKHIFYRLVSIWWSTSRSTWSFFCMHMMNPLWSPLQFLLPVTTEQIVLVATLWLYKQIRSHTNNAVSAEAFIQILANPKWKYCPYANIFFAGRCRDRKSCTLKIYLIGMLKCIVLQELKIIWRRFSKHLIKGTSSYIIIIIINVSFSVVVVAWAIDVIWCHLNSSRIQVAYSTNRIDIKYRYDY